MLVKNMNDKLNTMNDDIKTYLNESKFVSNRCRNKIIKMLIDNGADLNARDSNGKTVREYMSENASLTASDMAVAWKTLEENASVDSKKNITDEDVETLNSEETITSDDRIETEKED